MGAKKRVSHGLMSKHLHAGMGGGRGRIKLLNYDSARKEGGKKSRDVFEEGKKKGGQRIKIPPLPPPQAAAAPRLVAKNKEASDPAVLGGGEGGRERLNSRISRDFLLLMQVGRDGGGGNTDRPPTSTPTPTPTLPPLPPPLPPLNEEDEK